MSQGTESRAEYYRHYRRKQIRRKRAIERLGLLADYDGPLTDAGLPKALGDWILQRWRSDDSQSSAEKVERLLNALGAAPEVAEREIDFLAGAVRPDGGLSIVERRTLYLLSLGFVPKQIAILDEVSNDAIRERLRSARKVLNANHSTHAVAIAIRRGYLWH